MQSRQIILDTETTGLSVQDGHRLIEIAGVELINRKITGNNFHHYIRTDRAIDAGAFAVHGISNEFLADKPLFTEIVDAFLAFVDGAELVIHNAPFDTSFLNNELKLAGIPQSVADLCTVTDSLQLARKKHPGQQNNLDALCRRYSVDNSGREYHGALLDAHLLVSVYLAMTGGQISLFTETAVETKKNKVAAAAVAVQNTLQQQQKQAQVKLKVILAEAEEVEAHQRRLEAIKLGGGVCLWPL
jgi:DNA polymerase-3 subunit epsilon